MMLPDTCCSQRWLSHQLDEEEPGWLSTPWWQGASTPRATGWVELAVSPQPLPCTAISFRTDTKGSSQLLRQQVTPCENIQQHVWRAHEEGKPVAWEGGGEGKKARRSQVTSAWTTWGPGQLLASFQIPRALLKSGAYLPCRPIGWIT